MNGTSEINVEGGKQFVNVAQTNQQVTEPMGRLVLRWIVAGNPFYLISTVLVLMGIYLLSGEERLFASEGRQLMFNVGSVAGYGFLIVATAVFLFRRRVFYDTLMLAVLASLPMLVPFILISQAALLSSGSFVMVTIAAASAAAIQFGVFRRRIPELPFGDRLSWFVSAVLLLNVALPIGLHRLHATADAIRWALQLDQFGHWAWDLVLPGLVAVGFVVPVARRSRFGTFEVGWLPITWMLLLVAGTGVHLASLGYVYSFPWKTNLLLPALWLMTWLGVHRRREWWPEASSGQDDVLVAVPAFVGLCAWLSPTTGSVSWLNLMNVAGYGVLLLFGRSRRVMAALILFSGVSWLRNVPLELFGGAGAGIARSDLILLVLSALTIMAGCWRRQPIWGILTALAVIHPVQFFWLSSIRDWAVVGQLAMLVCWLHGMRWDIGLKEARVMRNVCFSLWWSHSLLWHLQSGGEGPIPLAAFACVFAVTAGLHAWVSGRRIDWALSALSLAILTFKGVPATYQWLRQIPIGVLVATLGLGCFAIGTAVAVWRDRLMEFGERLGLRAKE